MSDTTSEMVAPTGVTADLVQLDQIFDDARAKRNAVVDLLTPIIHKLTINTTEARQTEVQMQLINTYLSTISANEAAASRRVGSKLKQVEANTANKHSAAVAELLAKITVGSIQIGTASVQPSPEQSEADLERAFLENELDPISETELKTDHRDIE